MPATPNEAFETQMGGDPKPDNLVGLEVLDEGTIVNAVQLRYNDNKIYTLVGDVLLAVNPFKQISGLYGDRTKKQYLPTGVTTMTPHVYMVALAAYKNMTVLGQNQCVLISGESGAGKTESAKLFLNHILSFGDTDGEASSLEEGIAETQPLLEAFGNAKTVLNNNSSRFGKYIEIVYRNGMLSGANIRKYLLEKSRVVGQSMSECNFHIFYYIVAGCKAAGSEHGAAANLGALKDYRYFSDSARRELPTDIKFYEEVCL